MSLSKDIKDWCFNLLIFDRDLASLALGGLCSHFKEKLEGYDDPYISQLHIRSLLQENKFKKAKESCKAHQSNTRVDCEFDTLDDEKKETNSVMLATESNKDFLILLYNKKQVQLYKIIANPIK